MGVLNRPSDGQRTVLLALMRTLRAYGPMLEDRLRALCATEGVVEEESQNGRQVHKTLLRWKQLGLFVDDPSADPRLLRLRPPFDAMTLDDVEPVRSPLRALLLRAENNPTEGGGGDGDASDLSLSVSWMLQQDPFTFSPRWGDIEALQINQGAVPAFLSNSTRWDGLADWAPFLGLARMVENKMMPNPVHAVRPALPEVFGSETTLSIKAFLNTLAALVPVVDRGAYWQAAAARLKTPWLSLGPSQVSPCLSLALVQLDHERQIRLEHRSDAREVCQLLGRGGRELRPVSHVSLDKAAS